MHKFFFINKRLNTASVQGFQGFHPPLVLWIMNKGKSSERFMVYRSLNITCPAIKPQLWEDVILPKIKQFHSHLKWIRRTFSIKIYWGIIIIIICSSISDCHVISFEKKKCWTGHSNCWIMKDLPDFNLILIYLLFLCCEIIDWLHS